MTRIPMWRAAVLAACALALAACGGGDEEEGGSFCDQMTDVQADLGSLNTGDTDGLDAVVDRLEQVDPPAEIATAYEGVVAAYSAMAEGDLADPNPAVQEELVAAQEHMVDLFAYLSENCDLPVPGGGPLPGGAGG